MVKTCQCPDKKKLGLCFINYPENKTLYSRCSVCSGVVIKLTKSLLTIRTVLENMIARSKNQYHKKGDYCVCCDRKVEHHRKVAIIDIDNTFICITCLNKSNHNYKDIIMIGLIKTSKIIRDWKK